MVKLKAFTILESMVAMVIVMIVFGLSSVVMINISNSEVTKEKQNAYTMVGMLRNETMKQNRFIDETIELNTLRIEKTITGHPIDNNLKVMLITAYREKEKLYESKEIILPNNNLE